MNSIPSVPQGRVEAHVLDKVTFTHTQLSWLDSQFPEVTGKHLTDNELRFSNGQRSVLALLKTRVK